MIGPGIVRPFDTLAFVGGVQGVKTFENSDGTSFDAVRLFNATGVALTAGRPYIVGYDGDEETNPFVFVAVAALAFPVWQVIAVNATPVAAWDWFGYRGIMPVVAILGTTGIKDDHFHLSAAAPTGLTEAAGQPARTLATIGVLTETANPAGNYRFNLYGERAQVAA